MWTLQKLGLLLLGIALSVGAGLASGCREEPTTKDCEAAARKRANYFFGAERDRDTGSARKTKRSAKQEFEATMDDCTSGWSKKKAQCIAESRNRNMMITCK